MIEEVLQFVIVLVFVLFVRLNSLCPLILLQLNLLGKEKEKKEKKRKSEVKRVEDNSFSLSCTALCFI